MSKSNHTPGPWYVNDNGIDPIEIIPGEDFNEPALCVVERSSDARLIAAALRARGEPA